MQETPPRSVSYAAHCGQTLCLRNSTSAIIRTKPQNYQPEISRNLPSSLKIQHIICIETDIGFLIGPSALALTGVMDCRTVSALKCGEFYRGSCVPPGQSGSC
jgi:hypothetical protein